MAQNKHKEEQNNEPRNNPSYIWSNDFQQGCQSWGVQSSQQIGFVKLDTHRKRKKPDSYFTQTLMESGWKVGYNKNCKEPERKQHEVSWHWSWQWHCRHDTRHIDAETRNEQMGLSNENTSMEQRTQSEMWPTAQGHTCQPHRFLTDSSPDDEFLEVSSKRNSNIPIKTG